MQASPLRTWPGREPRSSPARPRRLGARGARRPARGRPGRRVFPRDRRRRWSGARHPLPRPQRRGAVRRRARQQEEEARSRGDVRRARRSAPRGARVRLVSAPRAGGPRRRSVRRDASRVVRRDASRVVRRDASRVDRRDQGPLRRAPERAGALRLRAQRRGSGRARRRRRFLPARERRAEVHASLWRVASLRPST
jgi:hypothetical protein